MLRNHEKTPKISTLFQDVFLMKRRCFGTKFSDFFFEIYWFKYDKSIPDLRSGVVIHLWYIACVQSRKKCKINRNRYQSCIVLLYFDDTIHPTCTLDDCAHVELKFVEFRAVFIELRHSFYTLFFLKCDFVGTNMFIFSCPWYADHIGQLHMKPDLIIHRMLPYLLKNMHRNILFHIDSCSKFCHFHPKKNNFLWKSFFTHIVHASKNQEVKAHRSTRRFQVLYLKLANNKTQNQRLSTAHFPPKK